MARRRRRRYPPCPVDSRSTTCTGSSCRSHFAPGFDRRCNSSPAAADVKQRVSQRAGVAWLTADQLADRLDRTLRDTNQRLAACCLQLRNDEDNWQLTEAGRHWGLALPRCSRGERRQQILWDPALLTLLQEAIR